MSLDKANEKCAVCSAYLFSEDDVVYCPICGAPHHRDCYNAIGHCGLEEYHGTDKQYKKIEPVVEEKTEPVQNNTVSCNMCGEEYDMNEDVCPHCEAPNMAKAGGHFVNFDLLGGVPKDMDLGNGVTANDAKKFVSSNTHRYIPKFAGFKAGKKLSWNWLAFLTPCGWLLSRKMYLLGAIIGALQVAFSLFLLPFNKAISYLDLSQITSYREYYNIILENIETIGSVAIAVAFVGVFLDLILRIIIAAAGDLIYKNHVITAVTEIKANGARFEDFRKKGGTNFIMGLCGIFAVEYLPQIIVSLTGLL